MKRLPSSILCSFAALALTTQAEPVRKPASVPKGVDLEAAAKATAALYATPPATPITPAPAAPLTTPARPVPVPLAAPPLRPAQMAGQTPRSSPLLPAAPSVPSQTETVGSSATDVWAGAYHCDHAEKVSLRPGATVDQVELQWKAQRWQMRRIDSRSGAMRLEDASARMVWIQLPHKSMLLDQRQGRRLLDECQHDEQVQTAAQMKNNPPPALFDTNGMGR